MSEWMRLKSPATSPKLAGTGVHVNVVISPYDIPRAVRGCKTPSGHFRIEFQYMDGDEPAEAVQIDKVLTMERGRHSGRLKTLMINLAMTDAKAISLNLRIGKLKEKLDSAWEYLRQRPQSKSQPQILEYARQAVETRQEELLNQMATQA